MHVQLPGSCGFWWATICGSSAGNELIRLDMAFEFPLILAMFFIQQWPRHVNLELFILFQGLGWQLIYHSDSAASILIDLFEKPYQCFVRRLCHCVFLGRLNGFEGWRHHFGHQLVQEILFVQMLATGQKESRAAPELRFIAKVHDPPPNGTLVFFVGCERHFPVPGLCRPATITIITKKIGHKQCQVSSSTTIGHVFDFVGQRGRVIRIVHLDGVVQHIHSVQKIHQRNHLFVE
mmetsp:Transcript_34302/g.70051  ORF Transcript_34302/g.70051 Transcript_34302/m.70051 type:complete len:235 (-) Transcript_34302:671-1375(-)